MKVHHREERAELELTRESHELVERHGVVVGTEVRGQPVLQLLVTELGVIGGCLFGGVPLGLALFPQQDQISAERLEPDFQGRRDSQGQPIQTFFFNKGL